MTIQHTLYIPTIFLLGIVFGVMLNERMRGIIEKPNDQLKYETSSNKLLQTFLIFIMVFVITHMFEIPWGSKTVSQLSGGLELFDNRPAFSSAEVYQRLNLFTNQGLIAYKHFTYTIDIIFPLSLFVFLLTFARFVSQRLAIPKNLTNVLLWLPFLWFASDLVENAVIFILLSKFPSQSKPLASSLGFITIIKFGLLLLSIFMPSLLFVFGNKVLRSIRK